MEYAEESIYQTDMNGQNILWYLEQNPVLRNTDLSDLIVKNLLIILSTCLILVFGS